ncbi:MAG: hypothetical protein ABR603_05340 [Pyrinomonadaceae bacterium]
MSDMPGGGKPDIADEAKGVSERFVQSLGLVELILGGVGLYWAGLWYRGEAARLFPTTGFSLVDVGLLAFAAALLGKLLCLFVAFVMALTRLAARHGRRFYYPQIEGAVCSYLGVADPAELPARLGQNKIDLIELSSYYVELADPSQRLRFDQIRTRAIVAYSAALLALPYLAYLVREGAPGSMLLVVLAGALLFLLLGFFEQLDYLKSLAETLVALRTAGAREGESDTHGTRP